MNLLSLYPFTAGRLNSGTALNARPWWHWCGILHFLEWKILFRKFWERKKWKFYIVFSRLQHVILCVAAAFNMEAEEVLIEHTLIFVLLLRVTQQHTAMFLSPLHELVSFHFCTQLLFQVSLSCRGMPLDCPHSWGQLHPAYIESGHTFTKNPGWFQSSDNS